MAIRITGMNSGMDTDAMVQELVGAYKKKGEKYTKAKTKTEWKQESWNDLNKKVKNFFSKTVTNMKFSSAYSKKKTTVSDSSKASIIASDKAVSGTMNLKVNSLAATAYLTGGELKTDKAGNKVNGNTTLADLGFAAEGNQTITINRGVKTVNESGEVSYSGTPLTFTVNKDTTMNEFAKCLAGAGYDANFDSATQRFFVSSKESGADSNFDLSDAAGISDLLKLSKDSGASKIDGADGSITLNGATFSSNSNTYSVNGLTITAKDVTTGSGVSISTETDVDAIYNEIKGFFKEYNALINEIDSKYNAASSKGYEPLTDEEKEAMSDDEIEKWEKKIKDSLLRQDSDLDKIANSMTKSMLKAYEVNGTTYSLSSFGINTMSYFEAADNEKHAYHIDGDSDDESSSNGSDRLRAMIAANPDDTAEFFRQLVSDLYDSMNEIQGRSDNTKSYGSFFSDKTIKKEYTDAESQISKWENYLADVENKYYKQFSAMESAMASLNSQQSYLSNLFSTQ